MTFIVEYCCVYRHTVGTLLREEGDLNRSLVLQINWVI